MRINKLQFENFKCFKNIELELGKITLLTGANSSGKSSIIYGILGAIQSGEFPFNFLLTENLLIWVIFRN